MEGIIAVRLPKPLENAVKQKCSEEDNSVSNFVRNLILNEMSKNSND